MVWVLQNKADLCCFSGPLLAISKNFSKTPDISMDFVVHLFEFLCVSLSGALTCKCFSHLGKKTSKC